MFDAFKTISRARFLAMALLFLAAIQSAPGQNFALNQDIDTSKASGNETDPAVAISPNNVSNIFVASVTSRTNGLFTTYTTNQTTWITNLIASSTNNGTNYTTNLVQAYGEPSVAWDINSNLFVAYLPANFQGIAVAYSTNGGASFLLLTNLVPNDVTDQPRLIAGGASTNSAAGMASVWLVYKDYSLTGTPLVAQGLITTNIGSNGIGAFSSAEVIPGSSSGGFPDIAIGPSNEVMVAYQNNVEFATPAKVFVNVNTNTTLTNGFGAAITVTTNAVGGLTYIPAEESANGINAGVGIGWDANATSPFYGRSYIVYSSGTSPGINIYSSFSVNAGKTWSTPIQVNDDTNGNDHFLPRIAVDETTGDVGFCWDDCRKDTGPSSTQIIGPIVNSGETNTYTNVFDLDGTPNDDYMVFETISTNGGTNVVTNLSTITIWTAALLTATKAPPPGGTFTYSSEAALANNVNGLGHHIGLAYESGNMYPVWPDNSDFLAGNPGPPQDFDLYTGYSILPTASLVISVTETPYPPTSDESIDYYVVVTNYGPYAATNVSITNTLGADTTLDLVRPAAGGSYSVSPNGETIVFSFASVPPKTAITNLIVITANQSGYVTNVSTVVSTTTTPAAPDTIYTNITNNTIQTSAANNLVTNIVLVNGEDLAIGMTASPLAVDIGTQVTYTIYVTNLGPAGNGLIYITNTFSSDLADVTNVTQSQGTYSITGNTIVFSLGTLGSNQSTAVSYMATALSLGNNHQYATNTAYVTSTDFDTNLLNNTTNAIVQILDEDLAVGLTSSATNVNIGDTITFTVSITNFGPSDTGDITVTNILSTNLGQITLTQLPEQGSGSVSGNAITFNLGELGAGQTSTFVYTAVALSLGTNYQVATNSVYVISTDFDTNLVNNYATNLLTINGEDLAIGLSSTPAIAWTNLPITYTVNVTNFGLSTSGYINVTNLLSTNQTSITVLQSPGSYTISGSGIVFHVGQLGLDGTATMVFTANPTSVGVATDTAVVGSTDFDTNLLNNIAQDNTTVIIPPAPISNFTVTPFASAAALKWITPLPATVQVAYGLTTNYGSLTSLAGPTTNPLVLLTGLTRDTNYYFSAMSWENGVLYVTNGSFATVDTLILTTVQGSYTGTWMEGSPSLANIYGSYFNVANTITNTSSPSATATFTPTIVSPGLYNISTWYPTGATNFSTNAQLAVNGATNGFEASVNQRINGGLWEPIATNLYLASGTGGNVVFKNDTGEASALVAANAVKWSYVDSQDYPTNGTVPGWWASLYFGTNTAAANAAFADYVFGLAPGGTNGNSPSFWISSVTSNALTVTFSPYVGGRNYALQTSTNLASTHWAALTNQVSLTTDGTGDAFFTVSTTNAMGNFFRLSAQLSTNY